MDIRTLKLSDLNPAKYNPRKDLKPGDAEYEKLKRSIEQFGYVEPVIWNATTGCVVGGHQRLKVLQDLGMTEVDCVVVELDIEHEKALNVALNKISGEWDTDKLALLITDLQGADFDVSLTGFDPSELDDLFKDSIKDGIHDDDFDVDAELKQPPVTRLGDLWTLGRHRLVCGDSCNPADVSKLMGEEKADLVFTDPPYGMKKEKDGVANDNLNYDDLLAFNRQWIPLTFDALKDNGSWYCWGIDEPLMDIYSNILKPMIKQNKITFRNIITWDKGNGQGQLSAEFRMYPIADEKCLFVMCGVQGFNNNADNYFEAWTPIVKYLESQRQKMNWSIKDTKRIAGHSEKSGCHWFDKSQWSLPTEETYNKWREAAKGNAFKREYDEIKREYYATRAYFDNTHDNMNNVWHFDRTSAAERETTGGHATPKPIALCSRAIKSSSREGEIVLDVFGGSGSTLIACEQTERMCYTSEIDPKFCDVIVKRYIAQVGSSDGVSVQRSGLTYSFDEVNANG